MNPNLFVDEFAAAVPSSTVSAEWLPTGDLLILTKSGQLRTINMANGSSSYGGQVSSVSTVGERGALDLTLDPNYAQNSRFYVYHSSNGSPSRLRVSRFVYNGTNHTATTSSQSVIWQSPGPGHLTNYHVGGSINVSADNKLLITIGDGLNATQSDDLTNVFGKALRINLDGSIPADNPFHDGGGPNLDEIYAYGLRNPFRSWVDPTNGDFWVGDVGGNYALQAYEEVNRVQAGEFYGWPLCEGPLGQPKSGPVCPAGTAGPWLNYDHDVNGGCCLNRSITGGERYYGTAMPSELSGAYVFGDWAEDKMYWVPVEADGSAGERNEIPVIADSKAVWVSVGPDGHIYYLRMSYQTTTFQLRRVRYSGTVDNPPTVSTITASPSGGPAPLTVTFSSDAADADGDTLSYAWTFGDGTTSTLAEPTHTFTSVGNYSVSLIVSANGSGAAADAFMMQVGLPPSVNIVSPVANSTFQAGDGLSLEAAGLDADGALDASSYSWDVRLIHDDHQHSRFEGSVGNPLPFLISTTGHDYRGSTGYEITVTLTDTDGLVATDQIQIYPEKVDLTITNDLGGGSLSVDGTTQLAPYVLDTAIGFEHTVEAPEEACFNNVAGEFSSWSDGGAREHSVVVPAVDSSLVASYANTGSCLPCFDTWEAELGDVVTAGLVEAADGTASGGAFLWTPDNTRANMLSAPTASTPVQEFCVLIPHDANDWYLEGDVATSGLDDNSNSIWVQIDDGDWRAWHLDDDLSWNVQEASPKGAARYEWNLTAGVHTLRLGHREDGTRIDAFRLRSDSTPEPPPDLVINEIHHNPAAGGVEFLELHNVGAAASLDGVEVEGLWTFGAGTTVAPGEFLVLTADLALFQSLYPGVPATEWNAGADLANGGEAIVVRAADGSEIDRVVYGN